MKIMFASAEVAPFSKVGGLADVVGSLPKVLEKMGHEIAIFTPLHGFIDEEKFGIREIENSKLTINYSYGEYYFRLKTAKLPGTNINVFFLDNSKYFAPFKEVYPRCIDTRYEHERFIAFSHAVIEYAKLLNFKPDIIHSNDWHTAMIPVYMKVNYKDDPFFSKTKNVFSIHNLAYQGQWFDDLLYFAQIDHKYVWNCWGLEHFGMLNWMKGAINYSDKIIVVSPNYAREIKTYEGGNGLDWTLNHNSHKLVGILNGVDYDVFNPQTDKSITKNYDVNHIGYKAENKKEILKEFGLEYNPEKPLIAIISRLVEQKGFDLIGPVCERLKQLEAQFVVLGTGAYKYEDMFRYLSGTSSNIRAKIEFGAHLSHKIYAGSDMFLMPSAFEPCGLGQLIALKYGSIPIVRATGGLDDTITGYPLENSDGFKFWNYDSYAMLDCINYALGVYKDKKVWKTLVQNAMQKDFSWNKSAKKYVEEYKSILQQG